MIKDTFFSSSRFLNLCRKEMVENWKTNVLRFVMIYGILAFIFLVNGYFKYGVSPEYTSMDRMIKISLTTFLSLTWILGCIYASTSFGNLKTKTGRLSILMVPATPFEKYFSRWLVSTIVFLLVLVIAYLLADYTRVLVYKLIFPEANVMVAHLKYLVSDGIIWPAETLIKVVVGYLFIHSLFFLGGSIWPKNAFIKTFAALLVIFMTYSVFTGTLIWLMWEGGSVYISNSAFRNLEADDIYRIQMSIMAVFTLFNWTIAYFRFKESEIINRL